MFACFRCLFARKVGSVWDVRPFRARSWPDTKEEGVHVLLAAYTHKHTLEAVSGSDNPQKMKIV